MKRPPEAVLIHAWSPLIIKEFANSGHLDAIGIFFLLLAFWFWMTGRMEGIPRSPWMDGSGIVRRRAWTVVGWTCSILSKYFALVLMPVFWRRIGFAGILVAASLSAAAFIPFLLMDSDGGAGISNTFAGFITFGREWKFNAGLFHAIEFAVGTQSSKFVGAGLIIGIMILIARKRLDSPRPASRAILILLFTSLALSPIVNPWYVTWLVPFLCLTVSPALLAFTALVNVSYAGFIESREILWLTAMEWGTVLCLLISHRGHLISFRPGVPAS